MKKLIFIALLLIIIVFGIVEYRKYYLKEASKESINLVNEMTLIKNEECDKFYISDEITNKVYNHVTKLNIDGEDDEAVTNVSWYDAITFCNELSLQNKLKPAYILKNDHIYFDKKANGYRRVLKNGRNIGEMICIIAKYFLSLHKRNKIGHKLNRIGCTISAQ